jgi:hypothetical protein
LTKAFRIDELTEQLTPGRGLITIVGADQAECGMRLKEIEAAGPRNAFQRRRGRSWRVRSRASCW